jgi:hypothetical protein
MLPFLSHFLPHPEGEHRALVVHRPALLVYLTVLAFFYLFLNFYKAIAPGVLGFASNIFTEQIVDFTNTERERNGLPALKFDALLSEAARRKAEDMFTNGYWAHVAPDGTTPWDFITASGYNYVYAGENLAKDFQDSDNVVRAWMDSPSHQRNILNQNYKDIGVAVVNGVLNGYETTLVVQIFGQKAPTMVAAQPLPVAVSPPTPTPVPAPAVSEEAVSTSTTGRSGSWTLSLTTSEPRFDVFVLTRTVSLTLGIIVLGFFLLDAVVAERRRTVRLSGHTLAHFGILILLLGIVWFLRPGTVL